METHSPATSPRSHSGAHGDPEDIVSLFITYDSAHKTSRKTAGDSSRNPQMHAAYSALGLQGDSQPEAHRSAEGESVP